LNGIAAKIHFEDKTSGVSNPATDDEQ